MIELMVVTTSMMMHMSIMNARNAIKGRNASGSISIFMVVF